MKLNSSGAGLFSINKKSPVSVELTGLLNFQLEL
jgi:hypothetical protein